MSKTMCETYDYGIEHPNQDTWHLGYSQFTDQIQQEAIAKRFSDMPPESYDLQGIVRALDTATIKNHSYRYTHEASNLRILGMPNSTRFEEVAISQQRAEYDALTGRAKKIGDFIYWFSRISHQAFVAQEALPEKKKFKHVSLEIGGIRQFGDWDASLKLDAMARNIPHQLVNAVPEDKELKMFAYGKKRDGILEDDRVTYISEFRKGYSLIPLDMRSNQGGGANGQSLNFDYTLVRRRRPIADVYVKGESDVILYKESIGLLVMGLLDRETRLAIVEDCREVYEKNKPADPDDKAQVKFIDTAAANIAGEIFEAGIRSASGVTKRMYPVSAHYVQAVGEKYTLLRPAA